MNLKVDLFPANSNLPFSQGYAIREIAKVYRGRILKSGQILQHIEEGSLLYVEIKNINTVELIVLDDGLKLNPRHVRIDGKDWKSWDGKTHVTNNEIQVEFNCTN